MEGDGGDDDEDPDGRDNAMVPNEILAQQLLLMIAKKVPTTKDDDFLAPILLHSTTKVEEVRTKAAGIQPVDGIGVKGQDAPMVSSHSKIQQFLISEKVPVTQDDDILAPIPYTAPPWWRMSETEVAGTRRVDGTGVGGLDLDVVVWPGDGGGEGRGYEGGGHREQTGAQLNAPEGMGYWSSI